MSKLGFIGLGIMGAPMAAHLIKAGHEVFLTTRSKVPADLLTGQASACNSAKEVAEKADIIFLMLPDTPDVAAVLFGDNGVASGLSAGQDRRGHEFDLADGDEGVRTKDQRARLRLPRRARVRRRSRRQGGQPDHHGRRPGGDLRAGQAAVRTDGQEHHAGRRQRRRPDLQGRQPDHRRAEHRRRRRSAAVCQQGRRRPGQGAPGADGRLCGLAHPGSAWRTHDQAHLQPGFSDRAAPEGFGPGAGRCAKRWAWRCRKPQARRS